MKPCYIRWVDSTYCFHGWEDANPEQADDDLATVETLGFLYKETDEFYVLVMSHSNERQVLGRLNVPRRSVLEIKEIKL